MDPNRELRDQLLQLSEACWDTLHLDTLVSRVGGMLFEWVQADVLAIIVPPGGGAASPTIEVTSRGSLVGATSQALRSHAARLLVQGGGPPHPPEAFELAPAGDLSPLRGAGRADAIYPLWSAPLRRDEEVIAVLALFGFQDWILSPRSTRLLEGIIPILSGAVHHARVIDHLVSCTTIDPLTGALNRRGFESVLAREWERACRNERPISMLLLDIDHFKGINDTHGHPAGDAALSGLAERLRGTLRRSDELCRIGGDEFAVVLPDTTIDNALRVAERLRGACAELTVSGAGGASTSITMSMGVAVAQPRWGLAASQLVARADAALYQSKRDGRARISQAM